MKRSVQMMYTFSFHQNKTRPSDPQEGSWCDMWGQKFKNKFKKLTGALSQSCWYPTTRVFVLFWKWPFWETAGTLRRGPGGMSEVKYLKKIRRALLDDNPGLGPTQEMTLQRGPGVTCVTSKNIKTFWPALWGDSNDAPKPKFWSHSRNDPLGRLPGQLQRGPGGTGEVENEKKS